MEKNTVPALIFGSDGSFLALSLVWQIFKKALQVVPAPAIRPAIQEYPRHHRNQQGSHEGARATPVRELIGWGKDQQGTNVKRANGQQSAAEHRRPPTNTRVIEAAANVEGWADPGQISAHRNTAFNRL